MVSHQWSVVSGESSMVIGHCDGMTNYHINRRRLASALLLTTLTHIGPQKRGWGIKLSYHDIIIGRMEIETYYVSYKVRHMTSEICDCG